MFGIDLNEPIAFHHASMRYFKEGEYHITRVCSDDVLLMVYEGVLRFEEDGMLYEVHPGEYHIQKHGSYQRGTEASSVPQYLYVHFWGEWAEGTNILPRSGNFSCEKLFELMEKMDVLSHSESTLTERTSVFLQILTSLYHANQVYGLANFMADYIAKNVQHPVSLAELSAEFNYSKNHIINLFKKEYGMTPYDYLTKKRIEKAQWLLESTGETMDAIASQCGFSDYSHLYKAFIKMTGQAPGTWRKEKLANPYGQGHGSSF